ncbi:3-oxoacyl-ACP synthase III family protein [Streptomyces sp. ISL-96]|uniref:3-oxoacyl-ACP synthase III family protein n=1 Tax=Streptomyces sp. ISL-96 TaxID=2819191 RepID=UPI002035B8CE|nr:3-oxoacyl-[acyl-carrier-protein] synthase III C-terminal domain-containing protein [Streptomyces sp. ISL-96]
MVRHLCPRLDEWMAREGVRPGRLQHLVSDVQRRLLEAHVRDDGQQASDLAVQAAAKALAAAGTAIEDVDLLLFASSCQDLLEPATAHIVAAKLGASCPVFDVKNACNSVLNALQIARALIESSQHHTILITCGETPTLGTRWHLPDVKALHAAAAGYTVSDAGAALLLKPGPAGEQDPGVLTTVFSADSTAWEICTVQAGGSMNWRPTDDEPTYVRLQGNLSTTGQQHASRALAAYQHELELVRTSKFIAIHQITVAQFHQTIAALGLPEERCLLTVAEHGNAASASLPLQLTLAQQTGHAGPGDLVALVGFASGFSAGITLIRL